MILNYVSLPYVSSNKYFTKQNNIKIVFIFYRMVNKRCVYCLSKQVCVVCNKCGIVLLCYSCFANKNMCAHCVFKEFKHVTSSENLKFNL